MSDFPSSQFIVTPNYMQLSAFLYLNRLGVSEFAHTSFFESKEKFLPERVSSVRLYRWIEICERELFDCAGFMKLESLSGFM